MSAQPEHPADHRVPAIPHTINAIGDALADTDRAQFYASVLAADEADVAGVMRRWWATAMLARARGAEQSRANVSAGRRLVAVTDLVHKYGAAG